MEKNYERQNEQLRRNIELLEQGITVKKYLQIENDIEVEGSTAIYNYFGMIFVIDLIVFKSIYTIKLKIFDWIIDKSV